MRKGNANINTARWWDEQWSGKRQYYLNASRDLVFSVIYAQLGPPPQRILDVGGGLSRFSIQILEMGHKPYLVDFSRVAVDAMREQGVQALRFDLNTLEGYEDFGEFDCAVAFEILEHLEQPERTLTMMQAHVGRAFFTVPNRSRERDTSPEHVHEWSRAAFREMLGGHWGHVGLRPIGGYLFAEVSGG